MGTKASKNLPPLFLGQLLLSDINFFNTIINFYFIFFLGNLDVCFSWCSIFRLVVWFGSVEGGSRVYKQTRDLIFLSIYIKKTASPSKAVAHQ